ncbi:peptidoglycan DD-metalloendopeptidase family protein [Psychromicrobium xiongbiense]|uniref:peptidoglycan DD-metalloendopeptidase family protein n=1 Tax=Psychromicrobium xiongbiense TaxID=3051184 RepID=UPI0025559EF5|nr:peptidoglycan DD-metalloendopeptidase family protein [Psychromicrobium sp. YIM S02556]
MLNSVGLEPSGLPHASVDGTLAHTPGPRRARRLDAVTTSVTEPFPPAEPPVAQSAGSSLRPRDAARRARQLESAGLTSAGLKSEPTPAVASSPVVAVAPRVAEEPRLSLTEAVAAALSEQEPLRRPRERQAARIAPVAIGTPSAQAHSAQAQPAPVQSTSSQAALRRARNTLGSRTKTHSGSRWITVRTAQRGSIVLAAAGLALAVVVPSSAGLLPASATSAQAESAPQPSSSRVTADAKVTLKFDGAQAASSTDPDSKLHDALKVSADKVTAAAAKGVLAAPLAPPLVPTSPFGYRVNPLTGQMGDMHTGQDFAVACGTQVFAAAGGTVTFAGWSNNGGGNRVEIDHGNGLTTTYNHNSAIKVTVGQKLNRGDLVSLSGTTGASTGCHLHFEVLIDGKPVDPLGWL